MKAVRTPDHGAAFAGAHSHSGMNPIAASLPEPDIRKLAACHASSHRGPRN